MPRRKLVNRNTRKLVRLGKTSLAITIPIEILKKLKWREHQKLVVRQFTERYRTYWYGTASSKTPRFKPLRGFKPYDPLLNFDQIKKLKTAQFKVAVF